MFHKRVCIILTRYTCKLLEQVVDDFYSPDHSPTKSFAFLDGVVSTKDVQLL